MHFFVLQYWVLQKLLAQSHWCGCYNLLDRSTALLSPHIPVPKPKSDPFIPLSPTPQKRAQQQVQVSLLDTKLRFSHELQQKKLNLQFKTKPHPPHISPTPNVDVKRKCWRAKHVCSEGRVKGQISDEVMRRTVVLLCKQSKIETNRQPIDK